MLRRDVTQDDYRPRLIREASFMAARERLASLEPGGTPEYPLNVESASQIEVRALSMPCLRCDGPYRLDEHTVEPFGRRQIRVVHEHCGHCGARRTVFFQVAPELVQ
jgi:hypothetical protein